MKRLMPILLLGAAVNLASGESYTITLPKEATLTLATKSKHYVDFSTVEPSTVEERNGLKSVTYDLPTGKVYNYRTSIPGGLTLAGYFTMAADETKRPSISFSLADYEGNPRLVNHDPMSNGGYETGDILLNINPRGHLEMQTGQTFKVHAMRSWELTDNTVSNYFIEPDFHYTVIGTDGKPSDDVVQVTRNPGSAWADIKAVGDGTAIILVTYDAISLSYYRNTERKDYLGGQLWGAIWPENTGVFVVTVGSDTSAVNPSMTINEDYNEDTLKLAGKNVDAEHDVFYYLDTEEGASYTFTPSGATDVTIAYPAIDDRMAAYSGFGTEGVTKNDDGSYTLMLRHGRQIVRLADGAGNAVYQVLTARRCHREITNLTHEGSDIFNPGDEVRIQYSGLFHPANKLAGVYNMSAYITYNGVPNGTSLTQGKGQYTFGSATSAQAVTVTIPADTDTVATPEFILDKGVIQVNGFGDPIGSHRDIDPEAGRSPNFSAVAHKTYFGHVPEVRIGLLRSGVTSPAHENPHVQAYYTLQGIPADRPSKGIYIAVMSDGTTRRIMLR